MKRHFYEQDLKLFMADHQDWEAVKALHILIERAGTAVSSMVLNYLIDCPDTTLLERTAEHLRLEYCGEMGITDAPPFEVPELAQFAVRGALDNPLTDARTLKEVNQRLNLLLARKAQTPEHNHPAIDTEIQALIKYRSEVTRPGGEIKNHEPQQRKSYQRLYAAFRRLLNKARHESPEAYRIIKAQLKTGKYCQWGK